MKVRMLVSMMGTSVSRESGDTIDVGDIEAVRLCDAGFAELLGPETASVKPARNASKPKGKQRVSKADNSASS